MKWPRNQLGEAKAADFLERVDAGQQLAVVALSAELRGASSVEVLQRAGQCTLRTVPPKRLN